MEHHTTTSRAEAERLLGIAEKLLRNKDLTSCKDFAVLAQETEPLLDGSDQILAVAEVLLAADKRVNNHHDWYAILQIGHRTDDSELIKKQYRRLALLLHPDKNKFAFADSAFGLVADAWNVLSDPGKKLAYDNEFSLFTKVDLIAMKKQKDLHQHTPQQTPRKQTDDDFSHQKLPVRRSARGSSTNTNSNSNTNNNAGRGSASGGAGRRNNLASNYSNNSGMRADRRVNFWTACPYCYNLYEYPRIYEGCCLRCQNCERAFTGMEISSMPPKVPGREAYYCCWGFFPMGFVAGDPEGEETADGGGFPNWMPPMFPGGGDDGVGAAVEEDGGRNKGSAPAPAPAPAPASAPAPAKVAKPGAKKRGRPRKNV